MPFTPISGCLRENPSGIDLFVRVMDPSLDGNGALWHRFGDASGWHPWENLGGQIVMGPTAVAKGQHEIDVFACSGPELHHIWWDGAWSAWHNTGGKFISPPRAVSSRPGRIDIVGVGLDGAMWHRSVDNGQWSGWESLGGSFLTSHDTQVIRGSEGAVHVFDLMRSGGVVHNQLQGSHWSGWENINAPYDGIPAAVSLYYDDNGPDVLQAFVQNGSTQSVSHGWKYPGGQWQWESSIADTPNAAYGVPIQAGYSYRSGFELSQATMLVLPKHFSTAKPISQVPPITKLPIATGGGMNSGGAQPLVYDPIGPFVLCVLGSQLNVKAMAGSWEKGNPPPDEWVEIDCLPPDAGGENFIISGHWGAHIFGLNGLSVYHAWLDGTPPYGQWEDLGHQPGW